MVPVRTILSLVKEKPPLHVRFASNRWLLGTDVAEAVLLELKRSHVHVFVHGCFHTEYSGQGNLKAQSSVQHAEILLHT